MRTLGGEAWEEFALAKKAPLLFHRRRPIDADFLWLPPRTPGTIETSERALSAAATASAQSLRFALA